MLRSDTWLRTTKSIPYLLALALLVSGFAALDQYGVTWDEAVGDLFFGQRYLLFFTTGDSEWLEFDKDIELPAPWPDLNSTNLRDRPWQHYPVASTLASAVSRLTTGLGLTDPFDGFHLLNLVLAAPFLVLLYHVVESRLGILAALFSVIFLFTSPRIVFSMMANIKDFPEMVFFGAALLVFFLGYERGSVVMTAGSGVLWGRRWEPRPTLSSCR